jgi:hypothetical protein
MRPARIPANPAIRKLRDILLNPISKFGRTHFSGGYIRGGAAISFQVLTILRTTHRGVMPHTAASAGDHNWFPKLVSGLLESLDGAGINGIQSAAIMAGEL